MSKNINVNPDHYKVAGRERPGEDIVQTEHKARFAKSHDELARRARQRNESLQGMAARATEEGEQGRLFGPEAAAAPRAAKARAAKKRAGAKKAAAKSKARATAKKKAPARGSASKRPARKK